MEFTFSIQGELKELAIFVAQLIREGVGFKVHQNATDIIIELTGGFQT